jgi:hypothetical protein
MSSSKQKQIDEFPIGSISFDLLQRSRRCSTFEAAFPGRQNEPTNEQIEVELISLKDKLWHHRKPPHRDR